MKLLQVEVYYLPKTARLMKIGLISVVHGTLSKALFLNEVKLNLISKFQFKVGPISQNIQGPDRRIRRWSRGMGHIK